MTKMDWSGLRVLHLDSAEQRTLETLGPVLKNLTELKLSSGSAPAATVFPSFLRNLTTSLTRLNLQNYDFQDNYTSLVDALGQTSGAHLTHLAITEHQWRQHRYCMYEEHRCQEGQTDYYLDRPYLNATHLVKLATTTPNITHLDLDISRVASNATDPSTWTLDYDTIHAAASLPQLRNLTLRLVSPEHFASLAGMIPRYRRYGPSHTHFSEPSLNRTSIPALFANLNQDRANAGQPPLAQLEIKTGMWDQRDQDWGMMGAPDELVGRWVCQSEGRSKESGPCFGGNSGIDYYHGVLHDPYSEDWSQPDLKAKRWWQELEHDEL